ncbi:unnamed protein product [Closterium sp. NIES-54]
MYTHSRKGSLLGEGGSDPLLVPLVPARSAFALPTLTRYLLHALPALARCLLQARHLPARVALPCSRCQQACFPCSLRALPARCARCSRVASAARALLAPPANCPRAVAPELLLLLALCPAKPHRATPPCPNRAAPRRPARATPPCPSRAALPKPCCPAPTEPHCLTVVFVAAAAAVAATVLQLWRPLLFSPLTERVTRCPCCHSYCQSMWTSRNATAALTVHSHLPLDQHSHFR